MQPSWEEQTRKGIFSRRLGFSPALEQAFSLDQMALYIPILRLSVSLIIVVYFSYFILDWVLFNRFVNDPAMATILGLATPAAMLGILSTWHPNPRVARTCIVLATLFNGAMLIIGYALELRHHQPAYTFSALIIYMYYVYFLLGIMHLHALLIATVSMVAHVTSAWWGGLPMPDLYDHAFMMTVVIVIGGLSSRMMELSFRHNWMSEQRRRYLVDYDALTGLYNLRTFFERADQLLERARVQQIPVTVMIAGLDHLPSYQHELGHLGTDACVQRVGTLLAAATAAPHLAGRLGGEQFVVMLEGQDEAAAQQFAQGLQTKVAQERIPHPGAPSGLASLHIALVSRADGLFASGRSAVQRAYERLLAVRAQKRALQEI